MKRIISILIFVQLFIYCGNENRNNNIEKNDSVVGRWSFLISNGYNCYICPKIKFDINGTGSLILSSKKNIKFNYKLLPGKKIKFDFKEKDEQKIFRQSEVFYYENETVDDFEHFDLIDLKDRVILHSLVRKSY